MSELLSRDDPPWMQETVSVADRQLTLRAQNSAMSLPSCPRQTTNTHVQLKGHRTVPPVFPPVPLTVLTGG